jgi:hypothetical protein
MNHPNRLSPNFNIEAVYADYGHPQRRSRNPLLSQRNRLLATDTSARRQFFQVTESHIQNRRSPLRSRGRGQCRLNTTSCWRRARFSKAISPTLPGKMRRRISEHHSANMEFSMRGRLRQSQLFTVGCCFGEAQYPRRQPSKRPWWSFSAPLKAPFT